MPLKYRNKPVEVDGYKFASKKEARRYHELKLLLNANVIDDLELQPRFPIELNGEKICTYVADFAYTENGKRITEDVKSEITRKNSTYRLKKKLVKAVYCIDIVEI